MTKQNEEEMMNFFVKAFKEVLAPILEKHDENFVNLDKGMESLKGQISGLEGRFDGLDGRMGSLEGRFDGLDGRMGSLEGQMVNLQDTLDSHTASLMELEKLPKLIGEVYQEVKGIRIMQRNQDERIAKLERKVTNI